MLHTATANSASDRVILMAHHTQRHLLIYMSRRTFPEKDFFILSEYTVINYQNKTFALVFRRRFLVTESCQELGAQLAVIFYSFNWRHLVRKRGKRSSSRKSLIPNNQLVKQVKGPGGYSRSLSCNFLPLLPPTIVRLVHLLF